MVCFLETFIWEQDQSAENRNEAFLFLSQQLQKSAEE